MSAFDRSLFWNVVVAAGLGCVIDGLIFRFAPDWTQGGTGFPPGEADVQVVGLLDREVADLRRIGAEVVDPF